MHNKRSLEIDRIRAFCVILVLLTHFSPYFFSGDGIFRVIRNITALGSFGVTGFFVVSGYLLSAILLRENKNNNSNILLRYYTRRILRIWPLYYATFLAVNLLSLLFKIKQNNIKSILTLTYNWTAYKNQNNILGHFWSMCAEEQFYAFLPFLIFIRNLKIRQYLLIAFIVASPVFRLFISHNLPYPAVWNFTVSHLDAFCSGTFLAILQSDQSSFKLYKIFGNRKRNHYKSLLVSVSFIYVIFSAISPKIIFESMWSSLTYFGVSLFFCICIYDASQNPKKVLSFFERSMSWIGQRTYGIYVFHWIVNVYSRQFIGSNYFFNFLIGVIAVFLTILFSAISFNYFEKPFLTLKKKFEK